MIVKMERRDTYIFAAWHTGKAGFVYIGEAMTWNKMFREIERYWLETAPDEKLEITIYDDTDEFGNRKIPNEL